MTPLAYLRAGTAAEAVGAVSADPRATYLAGGTTLVDLLQLEVVSPGTLVDINDLPLGRTETLPGGELRIGALVRNSDLAADEVVRKRYPVLSEAILSGASPQIRNMATSAGNLLQRTRCYYFRDGISPCNKRVPGSGCAAVRGFNRIHAVLGVSGKCIAAFPGDMPVALAALEAVVRTRGGRGERAIPIEEFYVSYGDDPARENVLEHGELITAIELPRASWLGRSTYLKVRDRASYEFALASAAVALDLDGGRIRQARIALGGIATRPWRARDAEKILAGATPGPAAYRAAAEAALHGARPQTHNAFKVELAKRTIVRALETAAGRDAA